MVGDPATLVPGDALRSHSCPCVLAWRRGCNGYGGQLGPRGRVSNDCGHSLARFAPLSSLLSQHASIHRSDRGRANRVCGLSSDMPAWQGQLLQIEYARQKVCNPPNAPVAAPQPAKFACCAPTLHQALLPLHGTRVSTNHNITEPRRRQNTSSGLTHLPYFVVRPPHSVFLFDL